LIDFHGFHRFNYPAETVFAGALTPRKSKIVIAGLQLLLKGISSQNISKAIIPIPYLHFTDKRSWGIQDFIFW
jgi:hypothetical protein